MALLNLCFLNYFLPMNEIVFQLIQSPHFQNQFSLHVEFLHILHEAML